MPGSRDSDSSSSASSSSEREDEFAAFDARPALGLGAGRPPMALDEFLPTSFSSSRSRPSTPSATPGLGAATPLTPAHTSSHKAPARVHRDFGKFSQQNRGIAIKMMEKMGYKMGEGLGSRGQGIVNPIEVKARPEKMGLAYKGRSERTAQSIQDEHKRKRAERRAAAGRDGDETGSDSSTSSTSVRPKASSGTKPARRKPKVVFQSVDEVIQRVEARLQGRSVTSEPAAAPALAKPATILDMTGPEVRERDLGSLTSSTPRAAGPDIGITGPSVEEDIRLIIDLCLADMSSQDQERRIQQHRLKALAQERTGIEDSLITTETEIDALETMVQATTSCEALARQVTQVPPEERQEMFEKLVDAVVDLHDRYASRWRDFDLEGFVTGVLAGPLATVLADWSPLAEPQFLQSALRRIRMAMTTHDYLYPPNTADPASAASGGDGPPAEWRHRLGTLSDHQFPSPGWSADEAQQRLLILDSLRKKDTRMTPYEALMYQSWLPRVRSALVNDWPIDRTGQPTSSPATVKAANESALQLVETWRPPLIPQYLFHHLVDHAVLPKLANAVDAYAPDRGTGHIHQWLHPWLPLLGAKAEPLLTSVRHKLGTYLKAWHPSQGYALQSISPWQYVLSESDWTKLFKRHILPKLRMALRTEFSVNPQDQKMDTLQWIMAWHDVAPLAALADLFVTEFFPPWHHVLHLWLAQAPDFEQITQWYMWWKSVFPENLRDHPAVATEFHKAVETIHRASG